MMNTTWVTYLDENIRYEKRKREEKNKLSLHRQIKYGCRAAIVIPVDCLTSCDCLRHEACHSASSERCWNKSRVKLNEKKRRKIICLACWCLYRYTITGSHCVLVNSLVTWSLENDCFLKVKVTLKPWVRNNSFISHDPSEKYLFTVDSDALSGCFVQNESPFAWEWWMINIWCSEINHLYTESKRVLWLWLLSQTYDRARERERETTFTCLLWLAGHVHCSEHRNTCFTTHAHNTTHNTTHGELHCLGWLIHISKRCTCYVDRCRSIATR